MRRLPILGFTMGVLILSSCGNGDSGSTPQAEQTAEIEALRRELALERQLRKALASELVAQQTLAEETAGQTAGASPEASEENTAERAPKDTAEATTAPQNGPPRPWFNADGLLSRGLPHHEVERLYEYFGESQMEQIELQNQAMREGWFKSRRYHRARRQIEADFRSKVGDEDYDLLLYGSGKRNRVLVANVVDRSPGAQAGFQAGDLIISYDENRIFRGSEIQQLSSQGRIGESVPVDVLRDGEIVRLYIDRGPMGFGLEHRLVWPHHLR